MKVYNNDYRGCVIMTLLEHESAVTEEEGLAVCEEILLCETLVSLSKVSLSIYTVICTV